MQVEGFSQLVRRGQGGLGDVYVATRLSTGSPVAIKMLRDWDDSGVSMHRAEREVKALVGLQGHSNVVHVEEVIEYDGVPLLVMEYAPGGSIADVVKERGKLSFPDAVLVGEQTARALAASHALGIIHFDIKPQNLLVGSFGQVKVCDFGIAALTQDERFKTRTNAHSLKYCSPEQLNDDDGIGQESDIYSLGTTLAFVATGTPLPVKTDDATRSKQPFVLERDPHFDAVPQDEFEGLVNACLQFDPSARPSAVELEREFARLGVALGDRRSRGIEVEPVALDHTEIAQVIPRVVTSTDGGQGESGIGADDVDGGLATTQPDGADSAPMGTAIAPIVAPDDRSAPTQAADSSWAREPNYNPGPTGGYNTGPTGGYYTNQQYYVDPYPPGYSSADSYYDNHGYGNQDSWNHVQPARRRRRPGTIALVSLFVVAALGGAGYAAYRSGVADRLTSTREGDGGATAPTPSNTDSTTDAPSPRSDPHNTAGVSPKNTEPEVPPSVTNGSPTPPVAEDPPSDPPSGNPGSDEDASFAEVQSLIANDRTVLAGMNGAKVPQLSAKQYDWVEPTSGQRFLWSQILFDHNLYRLKPHGAVLAAPNEFDDTEGAWYFTWVPIDLGTDEAVEAWCNSNGYVYGETCIAREVKVQ